MQLALTLQIHANEYCSSERNRLEKTKKKDFRVQCARRRNSNSNIQAKRCFCSLRLSSVGIGLDQFPSSSKHWNKNEKEDFKNRLT